MPATKDATRGNIELEDYTEDPTDLGAIQRNGGAIRAVDSVGLFGLRNSVGELRDTESPFSPNDDDVLRFDSVSGEWKAEALGAAPTVADIMQTVCSTTESSATDYERLQAFIYGGSDDWGTPNLIEAIAWTENAARPADLRIYDATNAQTIAELTGITDIVETIQNLGTISNVPAAPAIWEVQMKRPSGPPVTVHCLAVAIRMG